jgi:hypothetical protein
VMMMMMMMTMTMMTLPSTDNMTVSSSWNSSRDLCAEDTFLHCGFSWSDFYSWADGKIVWISPYVYFNLTGIGTGFQTDYRPFLSASIVPNEEDTTTRERLYVCASSEAHATIAADILLQLLTTCESRKVYLVSFRMIYLDLNTCHCRAIDALTRTDLQIELNCCAPT